MKEHFGKQFQEINESFSLVFSELFGGGKGELTLSRPQAMFLKAVLKLSHSFRVKVRRISICIRAVRSSFIAIALLFAILRVKPAPVAVLWMRLTRHLTM